MSLFCLALQGCVVLSCQTLSCAISTFTLHYCSHIPFEMRQEYLIFCEQQVNIHPTNVHQNTALRDLKGGHVMLARQEKRSVSLSCCSQGRPLRLKFIKPWCASSPHLPSSQFLFPPPPTSSLRCDWPPRAAARILIRLLFGLLTPR